MPIYLEFVSHHLLIGASHIYLPVPFGWNSYYMRQFLEIFQSYIQEGKYLKKNEWNALDGAKVKWNVLIIALIFKINRSCN